MWLDLIKKHNYIHPTACIMGKFIMGNGNYVGPYCTIYDGVQIGDNNKFCSHVSVGSPAEHKDEKFDWTKYKQHGKTIIGSNNFFREFIKINRATKI